MKRDYLKRLLPIDVSKIERHDLTPNNLEVSLGPNSLGDYEIRVALVFSEKETLPTLAEGLKPIKYSRKLSTPVQYVSINSRDSRNEQEKSKKQAREIYEAIVQVVKTGQYTLHTYTDGRLEFKFNLDKKKK